MAENLRAERLRIALTDAGALIVELANVSQEVAGRMAELDRTLQHAGRLVSSLVRLQGRVADLVSSTDEAPPLGGGLPRGYEALP